KNRLLKVAPNIVRVQVWLNPFERSLPPRRSNLRWIGASDSLTGAVESERNCASSSAHFKGYEDKATQAREASGSEASRWDNRADNRAGRPVERRSYCEPGRSAAETAVECARCSHASRRYATGHRGADRARRSEERRVG